MRNCICSKCGENDPTKFYKTSPYCKKCLAEWQREYRKTGKKYNYKKSKKQNRKKYEKRRLYYCMSARVRKSLKKGKGGEKWTKLVGYSVADLKEHLESLFDKTMNWNNYGDAWEIDHIKPIASFNINSYEDDDFKKCWSLSNLRPLIPYENRKRGAIFGNNRRLG